MEATTCEALRTQVVDDNAAVAEGISMRLDLLGHNMRTACDGPAALKEARDFKPQVGLLDIELPGMDGCELAMRLREGLADAQLSPGHENRL
ncbi:MAG: response regulator [Pseudomonadota bacterium]|nr:response regulator [Pseudomonadota bacterium]